MPQTTAAAQPLFSRTRLIATFRAPLAALLCACGGSDGGTPAPEPIAPTVALSTSAVDLRGLGSEIAVSATTAPSSATLAWRTDDAAVATVSSSGSSATVRAVAGGSTRVTATATNGTKRTDATIAVVVTPLVTALSLAAPASSPLVGDALTLVATIVQRDAGASNALDWKSSTPTVATVDSTGRVTTLAVGTTTISVASRTNATAIASVVLRVLGRARAVVVTPSADTALVGVTRTFSATVTADSGVVRTVRWRSGTPAVATVDATGRATALSVGTSVITALLDADTTIRASSALTVRAPAVLGIALSIRSLSLAAGDTAQLVANVTGEPGANTALTFASTVPAIATVSSSGLITAVGTGTVDITATSVSTPGRVSSVTLNIVRPAFNISWTETNDAAAPNGTPVPAMNAVGRQPDGVTYGVTATGDVWQRSTTAVWSKQSSPVTTALTSVSAPSNDSAWIGGASGLVLRRSGATWVREPVATTDEIRTIAASPSGAAYAITFTGMYGRIAGVWQAIAKPPNAPPNGWTISGLAMRGDTAYLAVNESIFVNNAVLFRYINGQWLTAVGPGGANRLGPMLAVSPTEMLVAAEHVVPASATNIYRWSNGVWTNETSLPGLTNFFSYARTFVRCDDGSFMATTTEGIALVRTNSAWSESAPTRAIGIYGVAAEVICAAGTQYEYSTGQLRGRVSGAALTFDQYVLNLSGLSVGGPSLAVASGGVLGVLWDGARWRPFVQPNQGAVIHAAFADGTAAARSFETVGAFAGGAWSWTRNTSTPSSFESAMWGLSNAALVVGIAGPLNSAVLSPLRIIRGGVSSELLPATNTTQIVRVNGASNSAIMAVGRCVDISPQSACVARYDGSQAVLQRVGNATFGAILNDVVVFSVSSAVAVGNAGTAFRWNGATWTPILPVPTTDDFTAVTGLSANEVYGFTSTGALFGYDGTSWRLLQRFRRGVSGARIVGNTAIAVGPNGMVLYGRMLTATRTP